MTGPIYLAHDHMGRAGDFAQDIEGGVSGKILHLTIDSWIDAPTREHYEAAYYSYDGYLERGLAAASSVLDIALDSSNRVRIVRTKRDLRAAQENGELAVILGNEGGKILGADLSLVDAWWQIGLRHVQFNWAMRNLIGASQSNEIEPDRPGLTAFGADVVKRMNERGMIVDVSHSAATTISDVLRVTDRPILNSHSGSREIADKQQNLWDDQIRDMAENGGVIGVHFCSRLVLGVNGKQAEIPDVVRQIRYLVDKGGIDVVGLGPDWVLGDPERDVKYLKNTDQTDIRWTRGLESSAEMQNLVPALEQDGFTTAEIDKILGGNLLRLFKDVLPD
jgi:membrane dipeptidase